MSGQPAPDQFHGAILRTRRGGVNAPNGLPAWRPVRLRWCQWLCPMGAPMAKNTRPGERAWATVRRTGGDYPWEVTLLPLVVNGCQAGSVVSPGYVRRSEDRLCEPQSQRLDHQRKHPVRGPPWAGGTAECSMGGFQVGSGIPEALNHILEGRISLNSCRSGAGPFLITAAWPVASSARLAPAMRLCSPYGRGSPSSAGISRTGLDSSSGEFPNNRG